MSTIINLTPHAITIRASSGAVLVEIPPSGSIARVEEEIIPERPIGAVRTTRTAPRAISGLPDPQPDHWYVVSQVTADGADALGRRTDDLLIPGQQTRDAAGRVDGCASLVRYQPMRSRLAPHHAWRYAARHLSAAATMAALDDSGRVVEIPLDAAIDALDRATSAMAGGVS
jgi:hypothetical protein